MTEDTNAPPSTADGDAPAPPRDLKILLKALVHGMTESGLRTRQAAFENVWNEDKNGNLDLPDNAIKALCKMLPLVLPRFTNGSSRHQAQSLIACLLKKNRSVTSVALTASLQETFSSWKQLVSSPASAKVALSALKWTRAIWEKADAEFISSPSGKSLLEVQGTLITVILGSDNTRLSKAGRHVLNMAWKANSLTKVELTKIIFKVEQSLTTLVISGIFVDWLISQGASEEAGKLKSGIFEALTKLVVSSKTKTPEVISKNLQPLLRHISHEEFKSAILPAIQKAMLRNPEIVLLSVAHIINGLNIDLSQYVDEFKKSFCTNLHAKDDQTREDAIKATANLSRGISDASALTTLLKAVFAVLGGSDGKLSVNTHKLSLLRAIGNMTKSAVSSSSLQDVIVVAVDSFIKFLESEAHEGSLVAALESLEQWMSKATSGVPPKFVEWLPKGLGLKTTTPAVRSAYLSCLSVALRGNKEAKADSAVAPLMKTVEAVVKQAAQIPVVTEAVHAASSLVKLDVDQAKLDEMWKLVLDGDKLYFTNDRFLLGASNEALRSLTDVAEVVLREKVVEMGAKEEPWLRAMVISATSASHETRKHAKGPIKKLCGTLGGDKLAIGFLAQLSDLILNVQTVALTKEGAEGNVVVTAQGIIDCLRAIAEGCKQVEDKGKAEEVAKAFLIPCSQPLVSETNKDLWSQLVSIINLTPEESLNNVNDVIEGLRAKLSDEKTTECAKIAAGTLAKAAPVKFVPKMVEIFEQTINNSKLNVSVQDYQIFLTPEGELFDKEFLENIQNENSSANMKRENKAYSYKEQMEELALRKEIEEKKKREGTYVAPKLNHKQKEALNAHLAKESETRAVVKELNDSVEYVLTILTAAIKENPKAFAGFVVRLQKSLFLGFQSPITAKESCQMLFDLRRAVFDSADESLSQTIAAMIIQMKKPSCPLPDNMDVQSVDLAVRSVVAQMGEASVAAQALNEEDACPFTTTAFAYAFPLFQRAVQKNMSDDEFLSKVCATLSEHAELRGLGDEASVCEPDELDPKYLPRCDMLNLLIEIISSSDKIMTQQNAVKSLIDVASCASGKSGCATATKEEFQSLLGALQRHEQCCRDAALRGLRAVVTAFPEKEETLYSDILKRVWIANFDPVEENIKLAEELWDIANFKVENDLAMNIIEDITHPVGCVRSASSEALAKLLESRQEDARAIMSLLLDTYKERLEMTPPVMDQFGRIIQKPIDHWEPRSGIAIALTKIAPYFEKDMVEELATFFVPGALGDRNEQVRIDMLQAAKKTIELHGKETVEKLIPVFEDFLEKAPSSGSYDNVRQAVVVLMGSLAKHLDPSDPKVRPIMRQLVMALSTPSQQVQMSVAECLPPLVPAIKDEAPKIVNQLIDTLLGEKVPYGERKGAAYGIAGIVKGLGILSLKQLDIMGKLTEAIQNKKSPTHREGALFAIEMLCSMLGRFFEPYIVHILRHLLLCFGDPVEHVRQAADDTAKAVMSNLSPHGVKLVLPSLLEALEEDKWRTKAGSVEVLGAMAFCAPKQLSSCLPQIVPKLIEVLSDSHTMVTKAGVQALKQIGSVIRNPEIQAIVPILLRALQDPAKKTGPCLQTLLNTKFVHFIDAPSLALIMPVVQRAFEDRSTETRKMAAQIIGNMYSLTDQKDLSPYLPGIIPGLKNSLLDPVPEVRAVSARALGAMVKGMGEKSFEELLPWLMSTLTSESSSVDRSGAAQGLSEVVGGLGVEKMNALLPDIIATAERSDIAPHVKDGYIMMFIYMPAVFPQEFTPYIGQIISPILRALADEAEYVRETAYKAGQRLVTNYADTAITMLLPELEKGLFDENWRIRHSSVQLLGDLLYKISGVSGKMSTQSAGDDDNFGTEASQRIVINTLGLERRNQVLAGLYMGRSDVALMVRQASLHVWKVIVSNTPKTLREILPTLFGLLLGCLASNSYDKRQIAARTLGDLVKKLGERVLPEIIPILERGLESEQPEKRQGVCVGLSEIMVSTSREMVLSFVDSLVPTVRKALCDDLPEVREAAAKTFDSLHNTVGSRALDDILPPMLENLDDPELHDNTLDGLRQVMAIKSRAVLPYLVPKLIAAPVNTRALASLAPVAGEALHRHLNRILPALLRSMSEKHGTEDEAQEQEYATMVVLSVSNDDEDMVGLSVIMEELMRGCKSEELGLKRSSITLLHAFCTDTKVDYFDYVPQLIRALILLFTEDDKIVLNQAWNALNSVIKTLDAADQMNHVADVRQAIRFALQDNKERDNLPGFCLPKGIAPILPIFRESILNGPPELKEQAAMGLGEAIVCTSPEALKPSVVHITGPLIRILGDRFSSGVKVAVLDTLASLLKKAKDMLKPFFPQLQTTFMKALSDANRNVRLKAGSALSFLITIHMRPDPLFNELQNGIKNADETGVRDTYIQALRSCIEPSGERMSAPIRKSILSLLTSLLSSEEDTSRTVASGCLGAFCRWLPEDELNAVATEQLLVDDASCDWTLRHGRATALFVALKIAPDQIYTEGWAPKIEKVILGYLGSDNIQIVESGVRAVGYLFALCLKSDKPVHVSLVTPFCKLINHSSNDVKLLVAVVSDFVAKSSKDMLPNDILKPLLPMLVNGTKEKNSAVKSSSEYALVNVAKMREGKEGINKCLKVLESGAQDALQDVVKGLQKIASQPEGKEEVIDNTILS